MASTKKETILEIHQKFFDALVFDAFSFIEVQKISEEKEPVVSKQHSTLLSA